MSMLLWWGKGDNDAIDLGDPGTVWKTFSEIGKILGDNPDFDELQSVPGFAEQEVTPFWLQQVREQGKKFLAEYGEQMKDHREVIEDLVKSIEAISEEDSQEGMSEEQVAELCDIFAAAKDPDWAEAVFCVAIDKTLDPAKALEVTKHTLEKHPTRPENDTFPPAVNPSPFLQ